MKHTCRLDAARRTRLRTSTLKLQDGPEFQMLREWWGSFSPGRQRNPQPLKETQVLQQP